MALLREKTEVQSQLEENEEDMADVMKKYKALVQQQTVDHITLNDQLRQIEELTTERDKLRSEVLSTALALKHTLMQLAFKVTYMHSSSFLSVIKHCASTISETNLILICSTLLNFVPKWLTFHVIVILSPSFLVSPGCGLEDAGTDVRGEQRGQDRRTATGEQGARPGNEARTRDHQQTPARGMSHVLYVIDTATIV